MSSFQTDEDHRLVRKAAAYLIQEHGVETEAEVEAAIRHATELNDRGAIDALKDILTFLRTSRRS